MRNKTGPNNYNWKGGKSISSGGYLLIYSPNHPQTNFSGYVREHIL